VWGNIAMLDRPDVNTALDNHLVLTLVNVEEERTLKNGKVISRLGSDQVGYSNRPVFLNLFLLFTANYSNYATALGRLTQVIKFFQGKQKFTFANSPAAGTAQPLVDFQLVLDLLSLSFEEVNHLWGFLGAKQSPSVVYRGRLVTVSDQRVLEGGGVVKDVEITGRSVIG
jgi:Pvc16 N-terminal domain